MDTAGVSKGWNACMNGPASGLKREALLDRKMRGILCPRRGRDTRPKRNQMTRRVSLDTPGLGKRMLNGLPAGYGTLAGRDGVLAHRGHGVPNEFLVDWSSLDVWGNYDGMLSQIQLERIPRPAPLGLHDIERDALEEILEGRSDPYTMPLQRFETSCVSGCLHLLQELRLRERTTGVRGFVREEVGCL